MPRALVRLLFVIVTSSKMLADWWEVLISFRKLLLVSFVMWSPGQELAFTLINLFVTVGALTAQAWVRPFANVDANLAEAVTLLCTILMLILGLGSGPVDANDGVTGPAQKYLNYSIYTVSGVCVVIATVVLCKRLVGALHSCVKGRKIVESEEYFKSLGGAVPDDVREMLHKRKLQLAVAWISLKSNDPKSGEPIKSPVGLGPDEVNPLISDCPLTHQERMKKVFVSCAMRCTLRLPSQSLLKATLSFAEKKLAIAGISQEVSGGDRTAAAGGVGGLLSEEAPPSDVRVEHAR